MQCFFGDCNPLSLYRELCKKDFTYADILKEEHRLTNLYLHALKDGAGFVRTPTRHCTKGYLESPEQYGQIEQIINVCISSAKNALKKINANAMLAGSVGNIRDAKIKPEKEILGELTENIVYISDFGVDMMLIEGIDDWDIFEITIGMCRKLTGNPIAPFFKTSNLNIALLHQYEDLCRDFGIELMGFELTPGALPALNRIKPSSDIPLGLILSLDNESAVPDEADIEQICLLSPTVMAGGEHVTRRLWLKLLSVFSHDKGVRSAV